jgi:hypothetical protein
MPNRPPWRDRLRGGDDGVGVDAVVPVEFGERAGLAAQNATCPTPDAPYSRSGTGTLNPLRVVETRL